MSKREYYFIREDPALGKAVPTWATEAPIGTVDKGIVNRFTGTDIQLIVDWWKKVFVMCVYY